MPRPNVVTQEEALQEAWKNPEFREAYLKLKPRYDLVSALVNRRCELGLTQAELAKRAKTHQSRISKIESAEHDLNLGTLVEIANALGAEVRISIAPREADVQVVEMPHPINLSISFDMLSAAFLPGVILAETKTQPGTSARTKVAWSGLPLASEEPEKVRVAA